MNERIKDRKVHKSCPQEAAISKTSGERSSKSMSSAHDQSTVTTDHGILSPGRIRILSGGFTKKVVEIALEGGMVQGFDLGSTAIRLPGLDN